MNPTLSAERPPARRWFRRRRGARSGVAAVEFAFLLPALVVLFIGTAEVVTYLQAWFRLTHASASTAQSGSRFEGMTRDGVEGLFQAAKALSDPYTAWSTLPSEVAARTVISAVGNNGAGNVVAWTCSRGAASLTPIIAGSAALPGGLVVPQGQTVLVVEIMNATPPWRILSRAGFFATTGPTPIRAHNIVRPRGAELGTLTGGCP